MANDPYMNKAMKAPQNLQQDTMTGFFRGEVVDVRDPQGLGRARVWAYQLHGDYKDSDIDSIPWAAPMQALRGSFSPPELGDRVWLTFEVGDKYAPIFFGFWDAIPMGKGKEPWSKKTGTEVRPEGWHFNDLYPESLVVASSGEGNTIWFEDKLVGEKGVLSSINIVDTGAKQIKIHSAHMDEEDYPSVHKFEPKGLDDLDEDESEAIRNGTEKIDSVPGAIELNTHYAKRHIIATSDIPSVEQFSQINEDEEVGIDSLNISGVIARHRQGQAAVSMINSNLFLGSLNHVFGPVLQTPKRYDK